MLGLESLLKEIRSCRVCVERPVGVVLPHEPRPVLQVSATARICVCGQAPGTRVHASGKPFTDPSGDRLRAWMGVSSDVFYDMSRVAVIPMGFCFPGLDGKGGDLPPRKECAVLWHERLFAELPNIELVLLVGQYAQKWHLKSHAERNLTETVRHWRSYIERGEGPDYFPTPHPSWRNNAWLKKNPWFEVEALPVLQSKVCALL